MDEHEKPKQATPHTALIEQLLDSRVPKTEREHAAGREIARYREALDEACAVLHMTPSDDPRATLRAIIEWNVKIALDPSVSSDAAALRDTYLAERDALREALCNAENVYGTGRSAAQELAIVLRIIREALARAE